MIWATKNNQRIKATPKEKAICPLCNEEVIAKCGHIKIWHWAHKSYFECDSFGEPETEWHFNWKNKFPNENQEIRMENHRADIRSNQGLIIELQNSPISPEKIYEREKFYVYHQQKSMVWILNGKTIAKNIKFYTQQYKWKWYPQSWNSSSFVIPIYIDKGDIFLYELNPNPDEMSFEKGTFKKISKDAFIIEHGGIPWKK